MEGEGPRGAWQDIVLRGPKACFFLRVGWVGAVRGGRAGS